VTNDLFSDFLINQNENLKEIDKQIEAENAKDEVIDKS